MISYCFKSGKSTESKNERMILSSNCEVCTNKKLRFIKEQEGKSMLS